MSFTTRGPNGPITMEACAGYVYAVGLRGEAAAVAVAVARAESSLDPSVRVYNTATGDDSYGLWQINMLGDLGPARRKRYGLMTDADLLDPATNARVMYGESGGGGNWRPWSAFKANRHAQYLAEARRAVATVEARGGNPSTGGGLGRVAGGSTAVDLGRSDDVVSGLPTAIDPAVARPRSASWESGFRIRGQSILRTVLADTATGGSVDLGVDDVAELSLEVGANEGYQWALAEELAVDADVDWADLLLRIVGVEWDEGDGQTYKLTARCRAAGPEDMRKRAGTFARTWEGMSPTEVMADLAAENGLRFVGEGSNRRDLITRKGPEDGTAQMPTTDSSDTESSWDLGARLAKEEGYWCFESAGTLYFARPSWLATRMPHFPVKVTGSLRGIDDYVGPANNGTVGIPQASRAKDDDLLPGLPPRTVKVRLPRDRGEQVRPGMVADFDGLPYFIGSYLVSRVHFEFDGGLEPAEVDLVDAKDPVPEPPTDPETGEPTVKSSAAPTGGGGASALDMVTIALRQIGDRYVYGVEVRLDDPDPTAFDCSELVQWAVAQVGVTFTDQSEAQMAAIERAGLTRSVAQCARIRGALLWHPGHIAISLGDGAHTVEAMGRQYGVVQGNIGSRFSRGGLVPGLVYPPGS